MQVLENSSCFAVLCDGWLQTQYFPARAAKAPDNRIEPMKTTLNLFRIAAPIVGILRGDFHGLPCR